MSALAISLIVGAVSLAWVVLSWRASVSRHLLLTLAVMVNLSVGQFLSIEVHQARWVSWSVAGILIVIAVLRSKREHWRQPALYLWGLALVFLGASYFLTDVSATVEKGLLFALAATTVLALLSSFVLLGRSMRSDRT